MPEPEAWLRWQAGIENRDPRALEALDRLLKRMGRRELLTVREREVLVLISHGHTDRSAAVELNVEQSTVKQHVKNILVSLGARNRTHAVAVALMSGLIE